MSNTENTEQFRQVMGNYPSGVTIMTALDENGQPVGMTVNSFASVSLDPLMVLWMIDHKSSSANIFKNATKFNAHLLAADQEAVLRTFSKKNIDRFAKVDWDIACNELPLITGSFGVFECDVVQTIEAGDHTIIIGEVSQIHSDIKEPLLYHRRTTGGIPEEFYLKL